MGVLTLTLNIHGMTVLQAKKLLEQQIRHLHKDYGQICVIHGYHHGNRLQTFVRKEFHSKRLVRKILTLNPGETILVIQ